MAPVSDPSSPWYNKHLEFVMSKCAFYQCSDCKKAFYGGLIDCELDNRNEALNVNKDDIMCKSCTNKQFAPGQTSCSIHGDKHIIWKCHKCCKEATYFCGGIHYLCTQHHDVGGPLQECTGGKKCPLGVSHPPASHKPRHSNFPLGCSLCLSRKVPEYKTEQNAPF